MSTAARLPAALAALACLGLADPAASATRLGSVRLQSCQLGAAGTPRRVSAECGRVAVPENREEPDGRSIELFVAIVRSRAKHPAPDPLVFLAGGPGQAASESFVPLAPAFSRIRSQRDVVLVDQRGTGRSNPLDCDLPAGAALREESGSAIAQRCLASLDTDPRHYATPVAVRDLEAVREALGAERLNLYGVSYGTRVALAYLRRHPDRVRSAILDGVVPADVALGPDTEQDARRALDALFARCQRDPGCAKAFPDVRASFDALSARLEREPATLRLRDPTSGQPTTLRLTRERFAAAVRLLSYAPETAALLPLLIETGSRGGDLAPLAAQSLLLEQEVAQTFSEGMQYAVVCSEDLPFAQPEAASGEASDASALRSRPFRRLAEICAHWPRATLPPGFRDPVVSDAPVLLLSGEADPVTPPRRGEHAAATLNNGLHLVAPGQGHLVATRGCVPKLMSAFVEAGSVSDLDATCVSDLEPAPFFLGMSGPGP
jgi:pimeloyl-ACP methyl ester carboxylesterase